MTSHRVVSMQLSAEKAGDGLASVTDHWLATGDLPPELLTGHKLLDFEHRFLIGAMANLRKVCIDHVAMRECRGCDTSRQTACESNLVRLLGDIFAFILDHFKTEESFMRDSLLLMVDRDVCQAHMEDHADIAAKVQQIVSALDSQHTVSRIRELDALLSRWVTNHIQLHDMLLTRWIGRDDSLLKGV